MKHLTIRRSWLLATLLAVLLLLAGCSMVTPSPIATLSAPALTPTTARIAANTTSGGLLDSPLVVDNQTVLLPTITPTTISHATPFPLSTRIPTPLPTPVTTPTRPPELQPIATPYYYATVQIAHSGITYTMRSDAGFGQFAFNDVSPCLCVGVQEPDVCRQALADYQSREHVVGVVETEACVSLDLADNRLVVFQDAIPEGDLAARGVVYRYLRPVPDTNYHMLLSGYWEGSDTLLVHRETGEVTVVPGYPTFAPDHSRFALLVSHTSFVQIWQLNDDGPRYEEGWRIANLPYPYSEIFPEINWLSATSVHLHWPIPVGYAYPPDEPEDVTITLEPQGWVVYRQEQPLPRLIVDPNSIEYANETDTRGYLDTLAVGEALYQDQAYVFTAIPDALAEAIQIRLPQSYYLGEDPSYFPLEAQLGNYLSFRVTDDAFVYVGLDAVVDELPDWMQAGWKVALFTVETNDIPLRLYHKRYPAGASVELVDRWMEEGRVPTQFVVIVKAVAE